MIVAADQLAGTAMEEDANYLAAWVNETLESRKLGNALPSSLYKFVSSESKHFPLSMLELFLHSRIYLSSRLDFNDPLDCNFGLDFPEDPELLKVCVRGLYERAPLNEHISDDHIAKIVSDPDGLRASYHRNMSESADRMGIYSLTDSVVHPLMWSHYGCSHRGIALQFRLPYIDPIAAHPIRYQDDYPRVTLKPDGIDVHYLLTKGRAWGYEREWRIVESNRARQWLEIPPNALEGIVLGALTTEETRSFLIDLVGRRADAGLPKLKLFRAQVGQSFDLSFLQLVGDGEWSPVLLA